MFSGLKGKAGSARPQCCLLGWFLYRTRLSRVELPTLAPQALQLDRRPRALTSSISYLTLALFHPFLEVSQSKKQRLTEMSANAAPIGHDEPANVHVFG